MGRRGAVVIGASSGVGRALADSLAREGYDLVLTARSARDLEAVAADVEARHGVRALPLELDLLASDHDLSAWFARCRSALPNADAVLIPAGIVHDDDDGLTDWELTDRLVATNFVGVVRVARLFLEEFENRNHGTLVLFSSIATAAPRRRNVAYTAAKSALGSYARSMQHRFADSGVRVQVYALGYVDTAMTRGRRLALPVVSASRVADTIVGGLHQSRRFQYSPGFWAVVAFILERLPWPIYRRLEF
jgi:decaprenylphospho-beta-D-erythro-pentofuranosid-2-ulose 2-reductase